MAPPEPSWTGADGCRQNCGTIVKIRPDKARLTQVQCGRHPPNPPPENSAPPGHLAAADRSLRSERTDPAATRAVR